MTKIYTCDICGKTFEEYNPYYKHTTRKNTCLSPDTSRKRTRLIRDQEEQIESLTQKYKVLKLEYDILKLKEGKSSQKESTRIDNFVKYLTENGLFESFETIFKGKKLSYKLLQQFVNIAQKKRNVSTTKKKQIYYDQKFECAKCNCDSAAMEIDHIKPLYQGGLNTFDNLEGLCPTCHAEKTIKDSVDFYDNIYLTTRYLFSDS